MKLNNHGWGLREAIFFIVALILILGLIVYLIITLYAGLGKSTTNKSINTIIVDRV